MDRRKSTRVFLRRNAAAGIRRTPAAFLTAGFRTAAYFLRSLTRAVSSAFALPFLAPLLSFLLPVFPHRASGQDLRENFVRCDTYLDSLGLHRTTSVQWFDGLGRPTVSATDGLGADGSVARVLREHDALGRTVREWLPGIDGEGGVLGHAGADAVRGLSVTCHGGDSVPFTSYVHDAFGRTVSVRGPGQEWADRNVGTEYGFNTAEGRQVKRYRVGADGGVSEGGVWAAGTLRREKTTDEDGRTLEAFTDPWGRRILERRAGDNDTYFVYDGAGLLRFVLTPMMQEDWNAERHAYEYRYDSNRLAGVTERVPYVPYENAFGFRKGGGEGESYEYNSDGALTRDPYKGVNMNYSRWGTPKRAKFDSGSFTDWEYTADGVRLGTWWHTAITGARGFSAEAEETQTETQAESQTRIQAQNPSQAQTETKGTAGNSVETPQVSLQTAPIYGYVENSEEFAGNYVFEDGRLSKYLFDGGYIDIASGQNTAAYRFHVRDHLGSVRVVLDDDGNVLQQLYYHPFGGVWGDAGTDIGLQPWKYSGKEYDHRDGLDLYDYGARLYDPAASRWTSPDPLCEKYYHLSPYVFCLNNPINCVDPDGRDGVLIIDKENQVITVKANYYVETVNRGSKVDRYVSQYSPESVSQMNATVSRDLNKLGLKVSKGEYKGYSISFDLTFIAGGTQAETTKSAGNDYYNNVHIGNSIYRTDETDPRFVPKEDSEGTRTYGGICDFGNTIMMNVKYDTAQNRLHEIFHTFGFEDFGKTERGDGIMHYPPQTPNQKDANKLVNNGVLPVMFK